MIYPVSDIMNRAAVLLNDSKLSNFTYDKQLPYVKIAMDELQEEYEQNNIPSTNAESGVLVLPAGATEIGFNTSPALPADLIEIQQLWEREATTDDTFLPMTKCDFLPHYLEGQIIDVLVYWVWEDQTIKFLGATIPCDLKLDYIKSIFPQNITKDTQIELINSKSFLSYRTAALCAEFIGENESRAEALNQNALLAMDRALSIPIKGRQSIAIRRRPFRASYKTRQIG